MTDTLGGSLVDSSLLETTKGSFDVRQESDVISLLKFLHQNTFDADSKNQIRDLVFSYRQDLQENKLVELHDALAPLGLSIVVPETGSRKIIENKPTPRSVNSLGIMRPRPRFRASAQLVNEMSSQETTVAAKPSQVENETEVVMPTPWPKETTTDSAPVPVSVPAEEDSIPSQKVTPSEQPVATTAASYDDVQNRIREIKRTVNEKVGNPINLIDSHNEIGREYMNALLDAMKKSNGGQQSEVSKAMERLETAFTSVSKVAQSSSKQEAAPQVQTQPPTQEQPVAKPQSGVITPIEIFDSAPEPVKETVRSIPVIEVIPDSVEQKTNTPQENVTQPQKAVPQQKPAQMQSVKEAIENGGIPKPQPQPVVQKTAPVATMPSYSNESLHSVAKEKQLQDLMRSNVEKQSETFEKQENERIAKMDPLQTPEVTAGLGQLLSEWSLFKNSGIFGTGPSGKDHVLYKKIAQLTMAAVIAGRFEGATPQVKQSITDYMNGWRYEEGIIHEHGETFEHYLRRVIHHILQRKSQK